MTATTERPITGPQLRLILVLFGDVDRDTRLEWCSVAVSRRIRSGLDLTANEASLIIDRLQREQEKPAW